jgi:pyruvate carboxylase
MANEVEHPVTEETTLVDIVALQIYVASGGLLNHLPYLSNLKQHVFPLLSVNIRATQLNSVFAQKIQ